MFCRRVTAPTWQHHPPAIAGQQYLTVLGALKEHKSDLFSDLIWWILMASMGTSPSRQRSYPTIHRAQVIYCLLCFCPDSDWPKEGFMFIILWLIGVVSKPVKSSLPSHSCLFPLRTTKTKRVHQALLLAFIFKCWYLLICIARFSHSLKCPLFKSCRAVDTFWVVY